MNEQWRKQMQKKLDGHRQAAPLMSWDEVERLAAMTATPAKAALWRRRWVAAAAAVVLLGGTAVTLLLLNNGQNARQVANIERQYAPQRNAANVLHNDANQTADNSATSQDGAENNILDNGTMQNSQANYIDNIVAQRQGDGASTFATAEEVDKQTTNTTQRTTETTPATQQYTPDYTSKNSTDNGPQRAQTTKTQPKRTEYLPVSQPQRTPNAKRKNGLWLAKAYISGGAMVANSSEVQRPALVMARAYGASLDDEVRSGEYVQLQDASPALETKAHHRQPIRVGAAVRYALNNRWSIDAGLTYARHRSELTRKAGAIVNETQQTLHYLGVPLNVNYRIAGKRRFNVYASAGVMGEKLLKGKRKSVTRYEGVADNEETETVKEKRVQLSVNAALGAEYKIDERLSVFAEPGVSYYFDNGSDLTSIYKDRPTNFNLNVGLRFCINK